MWKYLRRLSPPEPVMTNPPWPMDLAGFRIGNSEIPTFYGRLTTLTEAPDLWASNSDVAISDRRSPLKTSRHPRDPRRDSLWHWLRRVEDTKIQRSSVHGHPTRRCHAAPPEKSCISCQCSVCSVWKTVTKNTPHGFRFVLADSSDSQCIQVDPRVPLFLGQVQPIILQLGCHLVFHTSLKHWGQHVHWES